jgi:hypothetical protein
MVHWWMLVHCGPGITQHNNSRIPFKNSFPVLPNGYLADAHWVSGEFVCKLIVGIYFVRAPPHRLQNLSQVLITLYNCYSVQYSVSGSQVIYVGFHPRIVDW